MPSNACAIGLPPTIIGAHDMTATILEFPSNRCRQPATVIDAGERAEFEAAAKDHAARPNSAENIGTMMRLALQGECPTTSAHAGEWLMAQCNVRVVAE